MQKEVYRYISQKIGDKIVERKKCPRTGEDFAIFQGDIDLLDKISPTINNKKFNIASPTLSPMARMRRRMMFRNERGLYNVKSAISNKKTISVYHDSLVQNIVSLSELHGDDCNPLDRGINYNTDKNFFTQYKTFIDKTSRVGLININTENGDYNTFSSDSKNIYLCADVMRSENVLYSTTIKYVKNGYDLLQVRDSEMVYQCATSNNLTKSYSVWYSSNCYNSGFLMACRNCTNCWFCDNIENKQNYIFNKPATKEEIQEIKDLIKSSKGLEYLNKQFQKLLREKAVRPAEWIINSEKTTGSNVYNSKNSHMCFDSHNVEDCRYCMIAEDNKNCMDTTIFNPNSSLAYEMMSGGNMTHSYACITGWKSSNMYFCDYCMGCEYMIGCSGMNNKKYCIFNKQYIKEEWEKLAKQIIEQLQKEKLWGEFFPTELSPFPYNDTVAIDYFPIQKIKNNKTGEVKIINSEGTGIITILDPDKFISDAILDLGGSTKINIKWRTQDYEINISDYTNIVKAEDMPDNINDIFDDICKQTILCQKTGRPFKITPLELSFYRKMKIAVPRVHQSVRYKNMIERRPQKALYIRKSDKSGLDTLSIYPQDAKFKVYTQQEYINTIY